MVIICYYLEVILNSFYLSIYGQSIGFIGWFVCDIKVSEYQDRRRRRGFDR